MATPDDISDAFDDELTQSIVKGQDGPWRDDLPQFTDPTLKALGEQLAGKQARNYRERRLEDLHRRGINPEDAPRRVGRRPAAAGKKAGSAAPVWGEGDFVEPDAAVFADGDPEPATQPAAGRSAEPSSPASPTKPVGPVASPLTAHAASIAGAIFVVAVAAAAHSLLTGWSPMLIARTLGAGLVIGTLWQQFRTGRLRSTAIAACTYTLVFSPAEQIGRIEHIFALLLGLFAVVGGAALLGDRRAGH